MASGRASESRLIVNEAIKTSGRTVGSHTIVPPSTDLTLIGDPPAVPAFRLAGSGRRSHEEATVKTVRYTDVSSGPEGLR